MAVIPTVNTVIRDEILIKEGMRALEKNLVLFPWLANEFDGELKKQGDTVSVQVIPEITFSSATTAGAQIATSTTTITKESLLIDTIKTAGVYIGDYEEVINSFSLSQAFGGRFAYGANLAIETAAFTVLKAGINASNQLHEGSAVSITKDNIFQYIEEMRVALSSNNAYGESALFLSPSMASLIRQSAVYTGFKEGYDVRETGYVMSLSGFKIYESNNIGSNHLVGTVRNSTHFCVQMNGFKVVELSDRFGSNMLAELIMGGKIFTPNQYSSVTCKYT